MNVILYDGECGFCNASIAFVWKRDRKGLFSFAAIQSEAGRKLLAENGVPEPQLDTMYLHDGERLYERSTAALRISRELPGYRILATLGMIVPRLFRDWVYARVAANRHRILSGIKCELPPPEVRERFLDGGGQHFS